MYVDQNGNGALDRNFIGIPRESIGLSNDYRPKGPPSFGRASFRIEEDTVIEIELFRVLGERGQIGVGLGAIGRGSPYLDSTQSAYQLIPTIVYIGDRLQWLGPEVNFGLAGSDTARLALTASYRIGSYEADDSPVLADLGDRESTLLLGLGLDSICPGALSWKLPIGLTRWIVSEAVSRSWYFPEASRPGSSACHPSSPCPGRAPTSATTISGCRKMPRLPTSPHTLPEPRPLSAWVSPDLPSLRRTGERSSE